MCASALLARTVGGTHIFLEPDQLFLFVSFLDSIDVFPEIDLELVQLSLTDSVVVGISARLPENGDDVLIVFLDSVSYPDSVITQYFFISSF